mmetsp:Transcript_80607/g.261233  ORF Transcript_80607/g.261233 Transcript_80607/m.261233 type:complete len:231 (+) Transcript_80607:950-1642(+)
MPLEVVGHGDGVGDSRPGRLSLLGVLLSLPHCHDLLEELLLLVLELLLELLLLILHLLIPPLGSLSGGLHNLFLVLLPPLLGLLGPLLVRGAALRPGLRPPPLLRLRGLLLLLLRPHPQLVFLLVYHLLHGLFHLLELFLQLLLQLFLFVLLLLLAPLVVRLLVQRPSLHPLLTLGPLLPRLLGLFLPLPVLVPHQVEDLGPLLADHLVQDLLGLSGLPHLLHGPLVVLL